MKAIETTGFFDASGKLNVPDDFSLKNKALKVIILVPEQQEQATEEHWYKDALKSPAFDFLANNEEDIYTLNDGKAIENEI